MEPGRALSTSSRGGGSIPTKRNAGPGLILALLAVGLALALAWYPDVELGAIRRLVQVLGVSGVALMVVAMVAGAPWVVGWAAVVLAAQYGLSLVDRVAVDSRAPLYAAVLYLMVEVAYASLERRAWMAGVPGRFLREAGRHLAFGVGALGLAALVFLLGSIPVTYGILVQIAGVGAAAAILATLILLVRQRA